MKNLNKKCEMRKANLLIVEDSYLMQKILMEIIQLHFPEFTVAGTAKSVEDAIEAINTLQPDLVMLDIHLEGGTAFDVLKNVNHTRFKIIFVSAYQEYLIEALQFSAVDFIFKPFDMNDIAVALDKALAEIHHDLFSVPTSKILDTLFSNIETTSDNKKLVLIGENQIEVAPLKEINWCEAQTGHSVFHFINIPSFKTNTPLRRFESMLQPKGFLRCHPQFLVNTHHIAFVDKETRLIHLRNGEKVEFHPSRYELLKEKCELAVSNGLP